MCLFISAKVSLSYGTKKSYLERKNPVKCTHHKTQECKILLDTVLTSPTYPQFREAKPMKILMFDYIFPQR
jgi:hypothetical protein